MSEEIILTVPARHLTPGDHVWGFSVSRMQVHPGIDGKTIHHLDFTLVVPYTTHTMLLTVQEKDLDAISFPLTKRGDDYSPNRRNEALGLPPVPPKPYVAPEPIAVYPAGTLVKDVKHFDRSMHVAIACPQHPISAWTSKDPYSSNWFQQSRETIDCQGIGCKVNVGDYVLTHEYKPTRDG